MSWSTKILETIRHLDSLPFIIPAISHHELIVTVNGKFWTPELLRLSPKPSKQNDQLLVNMITPHSLSTQPPKPGMIPYSTD